ncbi:ATP-binding protein [Nostoc sp. PCC 7107]|nr:ATP-binding protein [Nostoc sp. PCC 7107]
MRPGAKNQSLIMVNLNSSHIDATPNWAISQLLILYEYLQKNLGALSTGLTHRLRKIEPQRRRGHGEMRV